MKYMNNKGPSLRAIISIAAVGTMLAGTPITTLTTFADDTTNSSDTATTKALMNIYMYTSNQDPTAAPPLALSTEVLYNYDDLKIQTYRQVFNDIGMNFPVEQYEVYSDYNNGKITVDEGVTEINKIADRSGNGHWNADEFKRYADEAWTDGLQGYEIDMAKLNEMLDSTVVITSHDASSINLPDFIIPFKKVADKPKATFPTADETAAVEFSSGAGPHITTNANGEFNAPSFGFGLHDITGEAQTLSMEDNVNKNTSKDTGYNLEVSDLSGLGSGWHVDAKLGTITTDEAIKLDSAILHLNTNGVSTTTVNKNDSNKPTASSVDLNQDSADSTIMNAKANSGMGTFQNDLSKSTLSVPNAEYSGEYVAPLTYTVSNTPA